ncbi:MAG: hypothetical protein WC567_03885 [Kiritimatiellia bacterium]|jgi:hypothetical protein
MIDQEKSLSDLIMEAVQVSWSCLYSTMTPDGHYFDVREESAMSEDEWNLISAHADGLIQKYINNQMDGRCSLQNMINFDIVAFEDKIKKEIVIMQSILNKLGMPRKLTVEELRVRGYKY